jgi:hypothetical protein
MKEKGRREEEGMSKCIIQILNSVWAATLWAKFLKMN